MKWNLLVGNTLKTSLELDIYFTCCTIWFDLTHNGQKYPESFSTAKPCAIWHLKYVGINGKYKGLTGAGVCER